jgi:hypothetical protein
MFIDFLYSNLELVAPKGMETEVVPIKAYRGPTHVAGCYQFSPEELAEINKTGVLWLSFMGQGWPPICVDAWIPRFKPVNMLFFGEEMPSICHLLQYLDLNLVILEVGEDKVSWNWRHRPGEGHDQDGGKLDIWDLEYRIRTVGAAGPFDSELKGGRYLFGEKLEIVGRLEELPRLQPLKMLYPMLRDDHLILMFPEERPKPKSATILGLDGQRFN